MNTFFTLSVKKSVRQLMFCSEKMFSGQNTLESMLAIAADVVVARG